MLMVFLYILLAFFLLSLILYLIWVIKFKWEKIKQVGAEFIPLLGGDSPPLAGDLAKINKLHPYILVYHKIDDGFEWGITRQKVGQFENQIKYLFENGYKSLSLQDTFQPEENSPVRNKSSECQLLECKASALPVEKSVVITFDDGYESVCKFAFPVLQKYGFVASVFIITGYVGTFNDWDVTWGKRFKHLSWEQIKELDKYGFSFGSHTVSHPDLTKLDSKSLECELSYSKKILEDKIGKRVVFLSYPFGKYNMKVQEMAKKTGYQRAYTICRSVTPPKTRLHAKTKSLHSEVLINSFTLERRGMYLIDSPLTLHIKLNDGRLFWIEDMKGRIINRFAAGTVLAKPKTHPPEIV